MNLKISPNTDFSVEIKNKIKEQCSESIELIQTKSNKDPHEVIHEVRKAFKKIRAALRLVRDHVDFYKEENVFFRDEGRRISDIRDATSVIEALDEIYDHYSDQLYQKTFSHFRDFLVSRQGKMEKTQVEADQVLATIGERLEQKCAEIDNWSIKIESFEDMAPSIERVYKRGRKAYKSALKSRSTEDLHEWRKRVKYLRYQLDLLNPLWPDFLESWEDELHDLSDYLGDNRDLYMLNALVEDHKDEFADAESCEMLKSLIRFRRNQLQTDALNIGKRLYRLEKEAFADLIRASWEAYEE